MPIPAAFLKKGKAAEGSEAEEKGEAPDMEKAEGKKPCAACKKKGKKKGSCGCAAKAAMDAALTPMEYLDACDLGIQNRSRGYIRGVLSVREDQKCGKSGIAKGKKCNKGLGTRGKIGAAMAIGGTIGGAAGIVGGIRSIGKGNLEQAHKRLAAANGATAIAATGNVMMAKDLGNKQAEKFNSGLVAGAGALAGANLALAGQNGRRSERFNKMRVGLVKEARGRISGDLSASKKSVKYASENFPDDKGLEITTRSRLGQTRSVTTAERKFLRSRIAQIKGSVPASAARKRKASK